MRTPSCVDSSSSVGELIDMASRYFGRPRARTLPNAIYRTLVHPLLKRTGPPERRRWVDTARQYFPYLSVGTRYQDSAARAALDPLDIRPEPLAGSFERLMDFAVAAEWGRSPISRADALRWRGVDDPVGLGQAQDAPRQLTIAA